MKTVITGHTYGLGRAVFNHFPGAVGIARSTGYDIERDFDHVVEIIKGCDLFINNAYANHSQVKLFNAVKDHVGKSIHMGSIARLYRDKFPSQYAFNKQELYEAIQQHNQIPQAHPALHLDISFLEKEFINDKTIVQVANAVRFTQVVDIIDVWLKDPCFTNIELAWKMTEQLQAEMLRVHSVNVT